jgi:hypothetical protein
MTWKPYTGSPFEGERIFKVVDKIETYTYTDHYFKNEGEKANYWDGTFYLDESESFTKEDMREAREEAFNAGYRLIINGITGGYKSFDEWLKEREGK